MRSGVEFELRVLAAVKKALEGGLLGLIPGRCEVFHQKGYPSAARGGRPIKVDVVIELRTDTSRRPSLLWIWECKDHASAIPVRDVERFHLALEQIGPGNTVGTIVTSNGAFQEAAWNYAIANNIGLARLVEREGDDEIEELYSFLPLWLLLLAIPHYVAFLFRRDRKKNWDDYWRDVRWEMGLTDMKEALCHRGDPRNKDFYGIGPLMNRPRPGLCFTLEAFIENELSKRGIVEKNN